VEQLVKLLEYSFVTCDISFYWVAATYYAHSREKRGKFLFKFLQSLGIGIPHREEVRQVDGGELAVQAAMELY
jgi:hypothetical protein